jgi:lipoprotein-releasing system permease protein
MLLSISIVTEFQSAIKSKITGLSGDILIESMANVQNGEQEILSDSISQQLQFVKKMENVKIASFALNKPCIVKGEEEIEGLIARAVDEEYPFQFIKKFISEGRIPNFKENSNEVIISSVTASKVNLKVGDKMVMMFFKNDESGTRAKAINPRIVGIFNTGISEYDNHTMYTSKAALRRVLTPNESFSQMEVFLKDGAISDHEVSSIQETVNPSLFQVRSAKEYNWQIFEWLKILDTNVWVIIAIMVLVAAITMCTTVLILITEKTNTIGMLKAMGATNGEVRRLFLLQASRIAIVGLLFGNLLAFLLGYLQTKTKFIKLDAETYYLDHVVLHFKLNHVILINVFSIVLVILIMMIPVSVISKLNPIKSIRFN